MAPVPNIVTDHPPCAKIPTIIYMDTIGGVNFIPQQYVDISVDIEAKRQMLLCHKSQEQWMIDMYGVGTVSMMENFARMRGSSAGLRLPKVFACHPCGRRTLSQKGFWERKLG